jgi:hypothetical protein
MKARTLKKGVDMIFIVIIMIIAVSGVTAVVGGHAVVC